MEGKNNIANNLLSLIGSYDKNAIYKLKNKNKKIVDKNLYIKPDSIYKVDDLINIDSNKLEGKTNYNACIVDLSEGGYRLFYRLKGNNLTTSSILATVKLDNDFNPIAETSKLLTGIYSNSKIYKKDFVWNYTFDNGHHTEDPRVILYKNNWFMSYTDNFNTFIAKLDYESCEVIYSHILPVPQVIDKHENSDGREKNWIPFVENDKVCILYSATPRQVMIYKDTGHNLELYDVHKEQKNIITRWKHGNIRGGCPPVKYSDTEYIWFFHSQIAVDMYSHVYLIGAYITNGLMSSPNKILSSPLIVGRPKDDYKQGDEFVHSVVFPCGAVEKNDGWLISMGINDFSIALLQVSKDKLLFDNI